MKKALWILALAFAANAYAQAPYGFADDASSWVPATLQDQERSDNGIYVECFYQTVDGGLSFNVVRRGVCPAAMNVNTETGQYR